MSEDSPKKKKLKITDHLNKLQEEDNKSEENIGESNKSGNAGRDNSQRMVSFMTVHGVDMITLMIPREKGIVSVTFRQKRDMVTLTIIMRIIVCIFPSPSI